MEQWKDVAGYEDYYQISSFGRLKTKGRKFKNVLTGGFSNTKEQIIKLQNVYNGYKGYYLCAGNKKGNILIHRLVALAFIPNPDNKPCVNHIDGTRYNNHVENLEWCTYAENETHSYRMLNKKVPNGENRWNSKLTPGDVHAIRSSNDPIGDIARKYGVAYATIKDVKTGRTWKHL